MEDIHECQCAQAGYCEFFKQEMTYDPPNWQWCQGASKSDRDQYKANCDKKHKRREEQNRSGWWWLHWQFSLGDILWVVIPGE